jgi:hypothetical protein
MVISTKYKVCESERRQGRGAMSNLDLAHSLFDMVGEGLYFKSSLPYY